MTHSSRETSPQWLARVRPITSVKGGSLARGGLQPAMSHEAHVSPRVVVGNSSQLLSNGGSSSSEQLDDECQLWSRALRLLHSRLGVDLPVRERISWNASRGVCLPLGLSRLVRTCALQLCSESDERQAVIDRLEESDRHLRTDLRYSQEKMQLYREKLASLQQQHRASAAAAASLDSARSSAYLDSVPDSLMSEREQELVNSKCVASSRAKALEARVESQEAEIRRLRKKLQEVERSEAERSLRQQEIFRSLRSRKPTKHSPLDNKMLDIIDGYEAQLQRMRLELRGGGCAEDPAAAAASDASEDSAGPGKGYRVTIEHLSQQVASLSDQLRRLESEREVLCTELESRPTTSDHVLLTSKLHRYERLLKQHNIDAGRDPAASGRDFSTRVEDADMLPLSLCQKYLKDAARLLDIEDFKQLREAIADLVSISDAYGIVHPILVKAQAVVQDDETAAGLTSSSSASEQQPPQLQQSGSDKVHRLVPALESWRDQMASLPELQRALERLFLRLYPWSSLERLGAGPDVRRLVSAIDRMTSDENYELLAPSGDGQETPQPPYSMLLGLMEHFRKLFDVTQLSGVCTKMNSLYTELGICRNAMNSIKESLGLVEQTPMEAVVSAVARLMQLERLTVNNKLQEIFSHEDVQLAFEKLDEYDQFFPLFEELVKNLMKILGVSRVDEILPVVTAHKRVFDAQQSAC